MGKAGAKISFSTSDKDKWQYMPSSNSQRIVGGTLKEVREHVSWALLEVSPLKDFPGAARLIIPPFVTLSTTFARTLDRWGAVGGILYNYRCPQYAAGGAGFQLHRFSHGRRRTHRPPGGVRGEQADFCQPSGQTDRGLHHRPVRVGKGGRIWSGLTSNAASTDCWTT